MKKSLTNLEYSRLFEIIGLSKEPLSRYQVKHRMKKFDPSSNHNYVYDRIKNLTPTSPEVLGTRLFSLNDFPSDNYEKRKQAAHKLIRKLKDFLYWNLIGKAPEDYSVNFEKSNEDNSRVITIMGLNTNGNCNSIRIKLYPVDDKRKFQGDMSIISNKGEIKMPLIIKQKQGETYVYSSKFQDVDTRTYLDHVPSTRAQKLTSEIKSRLHAKYPGPPYLDLINHPEVSKIRNDRRYWKYILNLRGFLVYLLSKPETNKIREMIKNMSIID